MKIRSTTHRPRAIRQNSGLKALILARSDARRARIEARRRGTPSARVSAVAPKGEGASGAATMACMKRRRFILPAPYLARQNISFSANCNRRWPLALVMVPKVPTEVTVVFGEPQVGEFVKLYASARKTVVTFSRNRKLLNSE